MKPVASASDTTIVQSVDKEADFSDEEDDELAYAADPDDSDF